jgi:hypothetical protein
MTSYDLDLCGLTIGMQKILKSKRCFRMTEYLSGYMKSLKSGMKRKIGMMKT